eukprot:5404594-Lingulodinium_polyedra.AAC.1
MPAAAKQGRARPRPGRKAETRHQLRRAHRALGLNVLLQPRASQLLATRGDRSSAERARSRLTRQTETNNALNERKKQRANT